MSIKKRTRTYERIERALIFLPRSYRFRTLLFAVEPDPEVAVLGATRRQSLAGAQINRSANAAERLLDSEERRVPSVHAAGKSRDLSEGYGERRFTESTEGR